MADTNKIPVRYAFGTRSALDALSSTTPGRLYFLTDEHSLWLDSPNGDRFQIITSTADDESSIEAISKEDLLALLQ